VTPIWSAKALLAKGLSIAHTRTWVSAASSCLRFAWKAFICEVQPEAADTQVLGVSMDSPFANKAFADQIGVTFPLLSDWAEMSPARYGVLRRQVQSRASRELPDRQRTENFWKSKLTKMPLIRRRS